MAVVVQRMVDARTAGVMFTRSPTTGDRSVIVIEGAWGLGSAVVSGEVTPDRWVVGKITGEITVREIRDKQIQHVPAPRGCETITWAMNAPRRLPERCGAAVSPGCRAQGRAPLWRPQDIEWAIDRKTSELLLLQSRPETVWSAKDSPAVARAADNPLSHLMSIFGGRR